MAKGYLIVNVYSGSVANPIENATVIVEKDGKTLFTTMTDQNGQTNKIPLETVEKSFSLEQQTEVRPYETYEIIVKALGLTETKIEGVQIFDGITSIQTVYLTSIDENQKEIVEEISPNKLWGSYPPILPESSQETEQNIAPIV